MTSEWMKVMLEEIARKRAEDEAVRIEEQRRDRAVVQSAACASRIEPGDAK